MRRDGEGGGRGMRRKGHEEGNGTIMGRRSLCFFHAWI